MLKYFIILLTPLSLMASESIDIQKILELSHTSPGAKEARAQAEASTYEAKAFKRNTYMPKVIGVGAYSKFQEEIGVKNPLKDTGLGEIPGLEMLKADTLATSDGGFFTRLHIEQPIIDISKIHYGRKSANKKIEAANLKRDQSIKDVQLKSLDIYLKLLEIRAKREALENYVTNLKNRENEIKRLYQLGGVSEADLLKVKLGIDDANQGIREISENENYLGEILGMLLGVDEVLVAKSLSDKLPKVKLNEEDIKPRSDMLALNQLIEGTHLEAKAASANFLPKLSLTGGITHWDQDFLNKQDFTDVALRLTWPIFDGAIGNAKKNEALSKKTMYEYQRRVAHKKIEADIDGSKRSLELREKEYLERLNGVQEARRAASLDFKRFKQGKINVNNLLDAEDLLKDRQEKASLSKLNWYREWFRYQFASGQDFRAP